MYKLSVYINYTESSKGVHNLATFIFYTVSVARVQVARLRGSLGTELLTLTILNIPPTFQFLLQRRAARRVFCAHRKTKAESVSSPPQTSLLLCVVILFVLLVLLRLVGLLVFVLLIVLAAAVGVFVITMHFYSFLSLYAKITVFGFNRDRIYYPAAPMDLFVKSKKFLTHNIQ